VALGEEQHDRADTGLVDRVPATELWDNTPWGVWDRLWRWFRVEHAEPMPSFQAPVEDPPDPHEDPRIGICCSGGGVRSASFNLGALQELRPTILQEAKYLAAVSGGSYIAAAFAMVANTRRPPPGDDSDPALVTEAHPPFYPGSPEEQYLRNRVSYLAPSGGGGLRLAWRVFCGLFINLVLIASATVLIAALVALYYRHAQPGLDNAGANFVASPNPWVWGTALGIALFGMLMGVLLVLVRPIDERVSRFAEAWSLRLTLLGLVGLALEVILPELLVQLREGGRLGTAREVIGRSIGGTVAGILVAVLLQIKARVADPGKAIETVSKTASWLNKLAPRLRLLVVNLAAYVLGPLLIVAMFTGATLLQVALEGWWLLVVPGAALLVFGVLYGLADLTSWSLHPFYRRRLCTAFALKRVKRIGIDGNEIEDDKMGRAVERDQREIVKLSETRVEPGWKSDKWPTLIVCAAANVSDPGATPPGRSVTSFTFSSEAMGGPLVGGITTSKFEEKLHKKRRRDFNLPAVVAMSGAALSPSMGKLTRPSLRFLMGLANVRLGVWVPNPRRVDDFIKTRKTLLQHSPQIGLREKVKLYVNPKLQLTPEQQETVRDEAKYQGREGAPRPRPIYLLKELVGMTSVNDKYLYITDGGHYENLGLVELLRRGCTRVYCFDATGGKGMRDLGDAIALARTELGVEIEFDRSDLGDLEEGKNGFAKQSCATGTIRYTRGKLAEGRLVYAPTVMTADVPLDLRAFKARDVLFPHHSTADQFFTDQKFEAYRVLGRHAARAAIEAMNRREKAPSRAMALARRLGGRPARRSPG
jgi:hypothetical protein